MKQAQIFGVAACAAALAAAGCGGGPTSNPTLPATSVHHDSLTNQRHGALTEYVIPRLDKRPRAFPIGITTGPDGELWFAERGVGELGRITTGGDVNGQFKIKGKARFPQNVVTGSDGNLWATTGSIHKYRKEARVAPDKYGAVISMTPAGVLTTHVFDLQMYSDPRDIALGPDGNIWFTESRGAIGKITLTLGTSGGDTLTEFPTPNDNGAFGITVGPDGALWFCEPFNRRINKIGRITTSGVITTFPFPKGRGPVHVVAGPDGNLYVTERFVSRIAQVTTAGVITKEFQLSAGSAPEGITLGADGNLYVTEFHAGKIAEVNLHKSKGHDVVTEFDIPTPQSRPWDIIGGPDGNIWFTESGSGKIGRLWL
jgi:streptogramin lyase